MSILINLLYSVFSSKRFLFNKMSSLSSQKRLSFYFIELKNRLVYQIFSLFLSFVLSYKNSSILLYWFVFPFTLNLNDSVLRFQHENSVSLNLRSNTSIDCLSFFELFKNLPFFLHSSLLKNAETKNEMIDASSFSSDVQSIISNFPFLEDFFFF